MKQKDAENSSPLCGYQIYLWKEYMMIANGLYSALINVQDYLMYMEINTKNFTKNMKKKVFMKNR